MNAPRKVRLRLFIARAAPHSAQAVAILEETLRAHAAVAAEIEIVDVHEEPERALKDRILVTPTLVRVSPTPQARVTGDLSAKGALLALLGMG